MRVTEHTFGSAGGFKLHVVEDENGTFLIYVNDTDWSFVRMTAVELAELGHAFVKMSADK